jgi:hypothetical protein
MKNVRMFRVIGMAVLVVAVGLFASCKGGTPKAKLEINKAEFKPGEVIVVKYAAMPEYDPSAWIGIIPSSVAHGSEAENDKHDIAYQYLRKSTSGELNFTTPSNPGSYDLRMHNTDNNGMEVASVTFKVIGTAQPTAEKTAPQPETKTASGKFKKGDPVMVEWKGSWWPARVIAMRQGKAPYKIHYDGYSNSWDEWVGNRRIRRR